MQASRQAPDSRVVGLMLIVLGAGWPVAGVFTEASAEAADIFTENNLVAWCVVPFDAKKRGPVERAEMLVSLGFKKLAYDWRPEHIPTFEQEILALKKHDIEFFAFWDAHESAFTLFEKHGIAPQIWITNPSPVAATDEARARAAAGQLRPVVQRAREIGSRVGLYNHGGWGGEPENLLRVCQELRRQGHAHVGIVYNFHHGHDHIHDFASVFPSMAPFLICLNLNGMNEDARPKILPIGQGQHELEMLRIVWQSDYQGPIGILDHRQDIDAAESLRQNLAGLRKLVPKL